MMSFLMKLTATGAAKIAAANAGDPVALTQMAVGDADDFPAPLPTGTETDLVNEVWRGTLISLSVSMLDPQVMIAEAVIPTAAGPFTVHEIGIFDADGDLFAYGNFPETYKPAPAEGSARELLIRVSIRVTTAENVTILIDESAIFATQAWSNGRFLQKAANLSDVADPDVARDNLAAAPLDSPIFTGNPRGPTPAVGDNDTSFATTAFVQQFFNNADMTKIGPDLPLTGGSTGFANIPQGFRCLLLEVSGAQVSANFSFVGFGISDNGDDWLRRDGGRFSTSDLIFGTVVLIGYRRQAGLAAYQFFPSPANRVVGFTEFNGGGMGGYRIDAGVSHIEVSVADEERNPGPTFTSGILRLWGF